MLQRPELFDVPYWALWLRLPIQLGLLWLIHWSTAPLAASGVLKDAMGTASRQ